MSFQSVNKDWEGLARRDAMWAILTNPEKAGNKWNKDDFFASGRNEIAVVFDQLKKSNALPIDNQSALDFGCGVGRLTHALSDLFQKVTGIDVSPTMIEKANNLNANPAKVSFKVNGNTTTNFKKASFSFIYTTIVLQHIPYPQQSEYVNEFCRLLKSGGVLVFQIPTKDIRNLSLIQKLKSTVKVRERLSKIGIGSYHHMQMNPVPENEIKSILTAAGCEVLQQLFTNHTDVDFGGNLKFMSREQSSGYESSLFIARKL